MRKNLFIISFIFLGIAGTYAEKTHSDPSPKATSADKLEYVGIESYLFNYFSSSQQMPQWCWAASIQMVLNYHNVAISQKEIVMRTYGSDPYGNLPNWSGSFEVITANLNYQGVDYRGQPYRVRSNVQVGPPDISMLLRELSNGHPIIGGYKSGFSSGHAVVITAASYINTHNGPVLQTIVVRDPWPSAQNAQNLGRNEYDAKAFFRAMQVHWYIRVDN
ncbi:MAG: papain-like cysteine protease family protein [Bacteroidota bacterium]